MELELIRTYFPEGTNRKFFYGGCLMMYSIEWPWKQNQTGFSCIPEGRYELMKQCSPKFDRHLQICPENSGMDVPKRKLVTIHSTNDACARSLASGETNLSGCIAPVTLLTGEGKGFRSRHAQEILISLAYEAFARKDRMYLIIKSMFNDTD